MKLKYRQELLIQDAVLKIYEDFKLRKTIDLYFKISDDFHFSWVDESAPWWVTYSAALLFLLFSKSFNLIVCIMFMGPLRATLPYLLYFRYSAKKAPFCLYINFTRYLYFRASLREVAAFYSHFSLTRFLERRNGF
jgi:hypothetical protein